MTMQWVGETVGVGAPPPAPPGWSGPWPPPKPPFWDLTGLSWPPLTGFGTTAPPGWQAAGLPWPPPPPPGWDPSFPWPPTAPVDWSAPAQPAPPPLPPPPQPEPVPGGPLPPPPEPVPAAPARRPVETALAIAGVAGILLLALIGTALGPSSMAALQLNPPQRRRRENPTVDDIAIANPCDAPGLLGGDRQTLFYWSLGAYGNTHVYTWADSYESAEEEMLEWVDDNAPGLLSTIGESDYEEAAEELGVEWDPSDPDSDVVEKAEADMIMVGHTTLKHGNAIPSWEVRVDEVHGAKREAVKRVSKILCDDEGPLPLPNT